MCFPTETSSQILKLELQDVHACEELTTLVLPRHKLWKIQVEQAQYQPV